jgi:mono/diheme cytochrome c family protein
VVLGVGTVLVAMRSGGGRPLLDPDKRGGRRATAILVGLAVLIGGIAVPVAVGIDAADRPEKAGAIKLTPEEQRGRTLFSPTCSQCHTLKASKGVGRVGPNLDQMRPPKELVLDAILKGRYRGRGQMPDKLFEGQDAEAISAYVAKVAGT